MHSKETHTPEGRGPETGDAHLAEPGRRAALEKLGTLAAWTPPAMLSLLLSSRASAASLGGPPNPPGGF